MASESLEVRAARVADAAELAAIHVQGRAWAYRGLMADALLDSEAIRREREAMWAHLVAQPPARTATLIAERDGVGVGLASIGPSRDDDAREGTGEVYSLYLRSEALAGTGIGRALMSAALERLRREGFDDVTLWALTTNERARAFYERGGWRPDGAEKVARLAGTPLPHVRLRLDRL